MNLYIILKIELFAMFQANKSWDSIKKEMKKCILLCANCHAIEHSTKLGEKFIKEALNYKGRTLEF